MKRKPLKLKRAELNFPADDPEVMGEELATVSAYDIRTSLLELGTEQLSLIRDRFHQITQIEESLIQTISTTPSLDNRIKILNYINDSFNKRAEFLAKIVKDSNIVPLLPPSVAINDHRRYTLKIGSKDEVEISAIGRENLRRLAAAAKSYVRNGK